MFLISEVHPFGDGNGRIARVMMDAELVSAAEQRIIIPQRTIRVEVAGGRLHSAHLPHDSQEVIRTQGRSAVEALLREEDPPTRVLVTSSANFTR